MLKKNNSTPPADPGERRADYVNQLYTLAERGAKPLGQHPKTLYETLWKPIEKELASASEEQPTLTIYYAPSGLLHRINLRYSRVD
ncbi:MAG: hypothetical protein H6574_14375 [Lewinellaceae bacterium]|nr:hypothetical protein [Lewinellaceae bacterium]